MAGEPQWEVGSQGLQSGSCGSLWSSEGCWGGGGGAGQPIPVSIPFWESLFLSHLLCPPARLQVFSLCMLFSAPPLHGPLLEFVL